MVKIKSMIRKSVNCLVTLSLMFFVFLFVYACSSDADYSAKIEDIDRNLLIKSVAESDVFLDFILEHGNGTVYGIYKKIVRYRIK